MSNFAIFLISFSGKAFSIAEHPFRCYACWYVHVRKATMYHSKLLHNKGRDNGSDKFSVYLLQYASASLSVQSTSYNSA